MSHPAGRAAHEVVAVNHVGISVRDLAVARTFWSSALGAEDHGAFGWPIGSAGADESLDLVDTAAEVALLRTGTAFLELFAFSSPAPVGRPGRAPGVRSLTWAVPDVAAAEQAAVEHGGRSDSPGTVRCPDGVQVRLVPARPAIGLVGIEVLVGVAEGHLLDGVPGPVDVTLVPGASDERPRPVDHGVNHVCLDVDGIAGVRESTVGAHWHHGVTESSGGAAAVCYGTTADGVLVELLESRSESAFFHRRHLTHG